MQGRSWGELLRLIPVAEHENLVLVTSNSTEIMVNTIVRMEEDYMVIRGRMAGTQEGNLVVIIPFDQINFMSIARKILEEEVHAMFASSPGAGSGVETMPIANVAKDTPVPITETAKPGQVSKSVLLARLRARLGKDAPKAP